jgi:hypothetical protein
MLEAIGAILVSLSISLFIVWLFGIMAAVLTACLIVWLATKLTQLINYWRFLYWLNQLHR